MLRLKEFSCFVCLLFAVANSEAASSWKRSNPHQKAPRVDPISALQSENYDFESLYPLPNRGNDVVIILAIDGGGIRGIVPARLIQTIETELLNWSMQRGAGTKPIHNLKDAVDILAGTSVGSILASMLVTNQKMTAAARSQDSTRPLRGRELVETVKNFGRQVFSQPFKRKIRTLKGVIGSKYSAKPLEDYLKRYLGETTLLSSTLKPLVIPAIMVNSKKPIIFKTSDFYETGHQYRLWEAVRSSSAAPTFFKGHTMEVAHINGTVRPELLIDGGVHANHPILYGYSEAKRLYPGKRYFVISLSTGKNTNPGHIKGKGKFAGGLLQLSRKPGQVLGATLDSALDLQYHKDEATLKSHSDVEYHRINIELPEGPNGCTKLDDYSDKSLNCMINAAEQAIKGPVFQKFIKRFKAVLGGQPLDSHQSQYTESHIERADAHTGFKGRSSVFNPSAGPLRHRPQ